MHLLIKTVSTILLIGIINFPALAADEESLARQAEQAGQYREALTHYVKALQSASEGNPKDRELREKIIKLVQKIQPPPAVPEETVKFEGRAEAALRSAKTAGEYLDAAKEYKEALRLAPWVAVYYFNLGVVLEKAGMQDEASRNFRLYLVAAPNAQDVREVKKRIAGLDYEMEKQTKTKIHPDQQLPDISGVWSRFKDGKWIETVEFRIIGRQIETRDVRWSRPYPLQDVTTWSLLVSDFYFDGKTIKSPLPPRRYLDRIKNWHMTIVNTNAMTEEYFYEGGEGAKRYQNGGMVNYITSPELFRFEWKREP